MSLETFLQREFALANVDGVIDITSENKHIPINVSKVTTIVEEVGGWHRAHAIHQWFIEYANNEYKPAVPTKYVDPGAIYIRLFDLTVLCDKCKQIVETADIPKIPGYCGSIIKNPEAMKEILPIPEKFHGPGGSQYDYWYIWNAENTIKYLEDAFEYEKLLNDKGIYPDYYYVII